MNTTILTSPKKVEYGYILFFVATLLLLTGMILVAQPAHAATFAPINSQLGVGSSGSNVTNLQAFLASDHYIYPEGRITGYYGGLTQAAVMQFQVNYGIPMVGAVGPMTLARINNVINAGYGIDVYAPNIFNISVHPTTNTSTFMWSTSEPANGKIFYSVNALGMTEAVGNFSAPSISGGLVVSTSSMQASQNVTVTNLLPHTLYYYVLQATDASGNVTVTNQSTFSTN